MLKPAIDVQFRIDPVKFYKLHVFEENEFFEQPSLLFTMSTMTRWHAPWW